MKTITSLNELNIKKRMNILIVISNPGFESMYCGGLIQKFYRLDSNIVIISMTDGENSNLRYKVRINQDLAKIRRKELEQACSFLGISTMINANFKQDHIQDDHQEAYEFLSDEINNYNPDLIIILDPEVVKKDVDTASIYKIIQNIYDNKKFNFKLLKLSIPNLFLNKDNHNKIKPKYQLKLSLFDTYNKIQACKSHQSQFDEDQNFEFWNTWNKLGFFENEYFTID